MRAIPSLGVILVGSLLASSALASNPFAPAADRAAIERLIDERIRRLEERLMAGGMASPGAPVGAPGDPALPPGALPPPGSTPEAVPSTPNPIAAAAQVRFAGCIDGRPVFRDSEGGRVTLPGRVVREAVEMGVIPPCR